MTLIDFILKAKIAGYATGGEGNKRKFDDGSVGFEIVSDGYRYFDRYNGFNPFVGSEYVYGSENTLIWQLNYFGEVLPSNTDSKAIYSFLKDAMQLITPEYPFRGPNTLEKLNLRYENIQNGSLERFHGVESIYEDNVRIYVLYYHGGLLHKTR